MSDSIRTRVRFIDPIIWACPSRVSRYPPHPFRYVRGPAPLLDRGGSAPSRATTKEMTNIHAVVTGGVCRYTIVNLVFVATVLARGDWWRLRRVGPRLSQEGRRQGLSVPGVPAAASAAGSSSTGAVSVATSCRVAGVVGSLRTLLHHHVDVDRSVVDARRAGGWRRARRGGRRGGGHGHCGAGRRTGVCRRVRAPFPIIFAMSVTTSVSWSVGFDEAPPLFPYCRLQASTTLAAIQSTVASSAEASAHRGRRRRTFPGLRCVAQTGHRAFACALPAGPCPRRT